MLNTVVVVLAILLGVTNLAWALLRLAESIYQESKNPDTGTFNKIVAVVKNYFKIS